MQWALADIGLAVLEHLLDNCHASAISRLIECALPLPLATDRPPPRQVVHQKDVLKKMRKNQLDKIRDKKYGNYSGIWYYKEEEEG